jgi:hypothetical protein
LRRLQDVTTISHGRRARWWLLFASVFGCREPARPEVAVDPCAGFQAALDAARTLRAAGRLGRALRAADALSVQCDRAGEARTLQAELRAELVPRDADNPLELVTRGEKLAAEGKKSEAQALFDRALATLLAHGPATLEAASRAAVLDEVRSADGAWSARRLANETAEVFRLSELRFVVPAPPDVVLEFSRSNDALRLRSIDGVSELDLNTGLFSSREEHTIAWDWLSSQTLGVRLGLPPSKRVGTIAGRPVNLDSGDAVVSLMRLPEGDGFAITATVKLPSNPPKGSPKKPSESLEVPVDLALVHVTATGEVGASKPLRTATCTRSKVPGIDVAEPCTIMGRPAITGDGETLVLPLFYHTLLVFDARTGAQRMEITRDDASSLAVSRDGSLLLTQTSGKPPRTRLYEVGAQGARVRWESSTLPVLSNPVFLDDGTLHTPDQIVDLATGAATLVRSRRLPTDVAAFEHRLAIGFDDGSVAVLQPAGAKWSKVGKKRVVRLRFAHDRPRLAAVTADNHITVVEVDESAPFIGFVANASDIALGPKGTSIAVVGGLSDVALWTFPPVRRSGAYASDWTGARNTVTWTEDGRFIAASEGADAVVFDGDTRAVVRTVHHASETGLAFARDGTLFGAGAMGVWSDHFDALLGSAPISMEVDGPDLFVGYEQGFDLRRSSDGVLVHQVGGVARPRAAFGGGRLYVSSSDATSPSIVVFDRGGNVLGRVRFDAERVWIDGVRDDGLHASLMQVVTGAPGDLRCAVGILRFPLAVCDALLVDAGPTDLLAALL